MYGFVPLFVRMIEKKNTVIKRLVRMARKIQFRFLGKEISYHSFL